MANVIIKRNPLKQEVEKKDFVDITLAEVLEQENLPEDDVVVFLNGKPTIFFGYVLKSDDIVNIFIKLRGNPEDPRTATKAGGGLAIVGGVAGIIAGIAMIASGYGVVPGVTSIILSISSIIGGSVMLATSGQLPNNIGSSNEVKNKPFLSGSRNKMRPGEPIPRVLGRFRFKPDIVGQPYTTIDSDGKQFLTQLFCCGQRDLIVSDIKIGESPISNFSGVLVSSSNKEAIQQYGFYRKETGIGKELYNNSSNIKVFNSHKFVYDGDDTVYCFLGYNDNDLVSQFFNVSKSQTLYSINNSTSFSTIELDLNEFNTSLLTGGGNVARAVTLSSSIVGIAVNSTTLVSLVEHTISYGGTDSGTFFRSSIIYKDRTSNEIQGVEVVLETATLSGTDYRHWQRTKNQPCALNKPIIWTGSYFITSLTWDTENHANEPLYQSTDGITWTKSSTYGVVFAPYIASLTVVSSDLIVVGTGDGNVYTYKPSTHTKTLKASNIFGSSHGIREIGYNGSIYVAIDRTTGQTVKSSTDLVTWTTRTLPVPTGITNPLYYYSISYHSGLSQFVISGVSKSSSLYWAHLWGSSNGITWTAFIDGSDVYYSKKESSIFRALLYPTPFNATQWFLDGNYKCNNTGVKSLVGAVSWSPVVIYTPNDSNSINVSYMCPNGLYTETNGSLSTVSVTINYSILKATEQVEIENGTITISGNQKNTLYGYLIEDFVPTGGDIDAKGQYILKFWRTSANSNDRRIQDSIYVQNCQVIKNYYPVKTKTLSTSSTIYVNFEESDNSVDLIGGTWSAFGISTGDRITISGTVSNDGTYKISSIVETDTKAILTTVYGGDPGIVDELAIDCDVTRLTEENYIIDITDPSRDKVTLLAVTIQASDQLNGVIDELSVVAQMQAYEYGGSGTGRANWVSPTATSNPAACYLDLISNSVITKKPTQDSMIDWAKLEEWWAFCNDPFNDVDPIEYHFETNGVIYQEEQISTILQKICATGRASFNFVDGKYSVIIGKEQTIPSQLFTPRNSWGFTGNRSFIDLPGTIKTTFINEVIDWESDSISYIDDANNVEIQTLELPFVTDKSQAYILSRYVMAAAKLQQEVFKVSCDFEYLAANRGDLVNLTHDVPLLGIQSGRIRGFITDDPPTQYVGIISDEVLAFDDVSGDTDYVLKVRYKTVVGGKLELAELAIDLATTTGSVAGGYTEIYLTTPITISGAAIDQDNLFAFGAQGMETGQYLITELEANEDLTATLTLIPYNANLYGKGTIPAMDNWVSSPFNGNRFTNLAMYPTDAPIREILSQSKETAGESMSFQEYVDGKVYDNGVVVLIKEATGITPTFPTSGWTTNARSIHLYANQYSALSGLDISYRWQISNNNTNWYKPKLAGGNNPTTDWKDGAENGYLEINSRNLSLKNVPLSLDGDGQPQATNYYFRFAIRKTDSDGTTVSNYSASTGAISISPITSADLVSGIITEVTIADDSITAPKLKSNSLITAKIDVTDWLKEPTEELLAVYSWDTTITASGDTQLDLSGVGNSATWQTTPAYTTSLGIRGTALYGAASGQTYIRTGILVPTGSFAILCWVKVASWGTTPGTNQFQQVVRSRTGAGSPAYYAQIYIVHESTGTKRWSIVASSFSSPSSLAYTGGLIDPDGWQCVVITYDGNEGQIWVNGVLVDDEINASYQLSADQYWEIGQAVSTATSGMPRVIVGDFALWDRGLTEGEIKYLYKVQRAPGIKLSGGMISAGKLQSIDLATSGAESGQPISVFDLDEGRIKLRNPNSTNILHVNPEDDGTIGDGDIVVGPVIAGNDGWWWDQSAGLLKLRGEILSLPKYLNNGYAGSYDGVTTIDGTSLGSLTPTLYADQTGIRSVHIEMNQFAGLTGLNIKYRWQISIDNSNWYSPKVSGGANGSTDWRTGALNGYLTSDINSLDMKNIPLTLSGSDPIATTYYFRGYVEKTIGVTTYVSLVSAVKTISITAATSGDIIANSITATKVAADAILARNILVSNWLNEPTDGLWMALDWDTTITASGATQPDLSGNNRNPNWNNTPDYTTGISGFALKADAASNHVIYNPGAPAAPTGAFSVNVFVTITVVGPTGGADTSRNVFDSRKTSSPSSYCYVYLRNTGSAFIWNITMRSGGVQIVGYSSAVSGITLTGSEQTLTTPLSFMVTLVSTGSVCLIYINGIEVAQANGSITLDADSTWRIGPRSVFGNTYKGAVDDFTIWSRALDSAEIKYLYNAQRGPRVATSGGLIRAGKLQSISAATSGAESGQPISSINLDTGEWKIRDAASNNVLHINETAGDVEIGRYNDTNGQGVLWDNSAATVKLKGSLEISGAGGEIQVLNGTDNVLHVNESASGDVEIGKYNDGGNGMMWDQSEDTLKVRGGLWISPTFEKEKPETIANAAVYEDSVASFLSSFQYLPGKITPLQHYTMTAEGPVGTPYYGNTMNSCYCGGGYLFGLYNYNNRVKLSTITATFSTLGTITITGGYASWAVAGVGVDDVISIVSTSDSNNTGIYKVISSTSSNTIIKCTDIFGRSISFVSGTGITISVILDNYNSTSSNEPALININTGEIFPILISGASTFSGIEYPTYCGNGLVVFRSVFSGYLYLVDINEIMNPVALLSGTTADNSCACIGLDRTAAKGNYPNQPNGDGLEFFSSSGLDIGPILTVYGTKYEGGVSGDWGRVNPKIVSSSYMLDGTSVVSSSDNNWKEIIGISKGTTSGTITIRKKTGDGILTTMSSSTTISGALGYEIIYQKDVGYRKFIGTQAHPVTSAGTQCLLSHDIWDICYVGNGIYVYVRNGDLHIYAKSINASDSLNGTQIITTSNNGLFVTTLEDNWILYCESFTYYCDWYTVKIIDESTDVTSSRIKVMTTPFIYRKPTYIGNGKVIMFYSGNAFHTIDIWPTLTTNYTGLV